MAQPYPISGRCEAPERLRPSAPWAGEGLPDAAGEGVGLNDGPAPVPEPQTAPRPTASSRSDGGADGGADGEADGGADGEADGGCDSTALASDALSSEAWVEALAALETRLLIERLEAHFGGPSAWQAISRDLARWAPANLSREVYERLVTCFEGVVFLHDLMTRRQEHG